MTRRQYRIIAFIVFAISIMVLFFLIWLSIDAVNETENWKPFDLDFTNKDGIINSYGALLAAILSFVSILYILLDLAYQRRLNTQEQERRREEQIQEYRDNLNIIILFIDRLSKQSIEYADDVAVFVDKEKTHPTEMNRMSFAPNTYPKLILNVDRNKFYESIRHFTPSENWEALYVDLYRIVDYYDKSFEELREKYVNHINKKYQLARDIGDRIDKFTDKCSDLRNQYIQFCKLRRLNPMDHPFFEPLEFVKNMAIEITRRKLNSEQRIDDSIYNPASILVWRDEVFNPFFDKVLELWNKYGQDDLNLREPHSMAQQLIRDTEKLIGDTLDYVHHLISYAKNYFTEDSKYLTRLNEIARQIKMAIEN